MKKKRLSIVVGIFLVLLAIPLTISAQTGEIPTWIKNTASFWADGQISDGEFVNAIEFLIESGIIQVPGIGI